ncbi:RNA polymerase sigma factor [Candidatus Omnitrophota bacterium]
MADESILKTQIERYQQKIFALVLYLIGGNQDKAYDITVSSFVKVLRVMSSIEKEDIFLTAVAAVAIEKSRNAKVVPSFKESDLENFPLVKRQSLSLLRRSFQSLSFETRTMLLLRDQMHLSHKNIAAILHVSESTARSQITQARVVLRDKVKDILSGGG